MDVRPPARVAGGKDAGIGDHAGGVGDLDTAQVVLVADVLLYIEYSPARLQCQT